MARKTNTLSLAASFKLMKLIEAEYTTKGVADTDFAAFASKQLGFTVNADHVYNRRTQLGIAATRTTNTAAKKMDTTAMLTLIGELERRVAALEKALDCTL
jgi:uncharacterized protein YdeI (BOF family)